MESKTVRTRSGFQMHYLVSKDTDLCPGPEQRAPVVLVPGLVVASVYMVPLAEALLPWFRVYCPDLPGFGLSNRATRQALDIPQLADALKEWMDACHLGRAALVGNSMGCQIIVELAARYPHMVDRCVLQGPTMDITKRSAATQIVRLMLNGLKEPFSMTLVMLVDYYRAGLWRARRTIHHALHHRMDLKLPDVDVPTMVVASTKDPVAPLGWCSQVSTAVAHGMLVELEGAAHTANYSATAQLVRAILPFLLSSDPTGFVSRRCHQHIIHSSSLEPALSCVADFDSASAMLRYTIHSLHGIDSPNLATEGRLMTRKALHLLSHFPQKVRETVYTWAGTLEAVSMDALASIQTDVLYEKLIKHYPTDRTYPVIAVGSANGALAHLWAAAGIPWLPQTVLIPVKRQQEEGHKPGGEIDMSREMNWSLSVAPLLLQRNPDLQVHHMTDPNQDQLMIHRMAYFRIKCRRLVDPYQRFIKKLLAPGGTILVVRDDSKWPCVQLSERHFFQPGAEGGISPEEYIQPNMRMHELIEKYHPKGSPHVVDGGEDGHLRDWNAPEPNCECAEAEWGLEPSIVEDIEAFAQRGHYQVQTLAYGNPQDPSPFVADFYREWYKLKRHIEPDKMLVESFILIEPWWTIRLGLVPYWTVFSTKKFTDSVRSYLRKAQKDGRPMRRVYAALFSHGTESIGITDENEFASMASDLAPEGFEFVGMHVSHYPRDFLSLLRFHDALRSLDEPHCVMPDWVSWEHIVAFFREHQHEYPQIRLEG